MFQIPFSSNSSQSKIQECRQQGDGSVSNHRHCLENIWKDYSGLILNDHMTLIFVTSFINEPHAELREHTKKYCINQKNALLSEIHALPKSHKLIKLNPHYLLRAFQLKPIKGNHMKNFKPSSVSLNLPQIITPVDTVRKRNIGLKINQKEKESLAQQLPQRICFCLSPNTLKHWRK